MRATFFYKSNRWDDRPQTWVLDHVTRYELLSEGTWWDEEGSSHYNDYPTLRLWMIGQDKPILAELQDDSIFYFFLYFQDEESMRKLKEMNERIDRERLKAHERWKADQIKTAEQARLSAGMLLPSDVA